MGLLLWGCGFSMDFWLKFTFLQFTMEHCNSCSHQFWGFPSPPPCDPGSAKISLLALFSHRLEFLFSLFFPPVFLIENNISLPHLGSSEPQHCIQNSCKQENFLSAAEIYRLCFFFKVQVSLKK